MTTDTPGLTQSNERVSLSFKRCGCRDVAVLHYGGYANGFQFESHLADFFLTFFQAHVLPLRVRAPVRFYLFTFTSFLPAYCTLIMRYCYVTGGVFISFILHDPQVYL